MLFVMYGCFKISANFVNLSSMRVQNVCFMCPFYLINLIFLSGNATKLSGTQVLGFMIEVVGTTFEQHSQVIFPQCTKILSLALSSLDTKASEADESGKAQFWQEAYFSLTMMEKFFQKFPKMIFKPECKVIFMNLYMMYLNLDTSLYFEFLLALWSSVLVSDAVSRSCDLTKALSPGKIVIDLGTFEA